MGAMSPCIVCNWTSGGSERTEGNALSWPNGGLPWSGAYISSLRVAVQPDDPGVHHVEVEQHRREPHQADPGRAAAPPAGGGAGVQVGGEHHPDDEGPGLLGIPAPVSAPRRLGPDRAGDDGEGPDREAEGG